MSAKAFGADAVAVTDIKPDNLDLARSLGADAALLLEAPGDPTEVGAARVIQQVLIKKGHRLCRCCNALSTDVSGDCDIKAISF